MALEGTLESFGMGEILQLIAQQAKTGSLEIETGDGVARLRFLDGRLVEAWPDKRSPTELIGIRLARAELITPAQLEYALESQRHSLRQLGDILVRSGALRVGDFQEVLNLQHRETVYQLLRLKRGKFHFYPEAVALEEGVSIPMEVEALLMEGSRQIDEWPQVLARVPSENRVFSRAEEQVANSLSREEARALSFVDGVSNVREVVDRARLGEFEGWEALASLADKGLITPVNLFRRPRPRDLKRVSSRRSGVDVLLAATCVTVAAVLFLAVPPVDGGPAARFRLAVREARREARSLADRRNAWFRSTPSVWPPVPSGNG